MPTDVLEQYGNGEFPLNFVPTAANGNFLEPDKVAVRHGYCGDPEQVDKHCMLTAGETEGLRVFSTISHLSSGGRTPMHAQQAGNA